MKNPFDKSYFNRDRNNSWFHNYFIQFTHKHEPFFSILKRRKIKGSKLLDIGCGDGIFLQYVQDYFECAGIDISKEGLKIARKKAPKAKLVYKSVYNLSDFPKKSFDIVTCFDVLEHVIEIPKILKQIFRILKDNGILVISVPNGDSLGKKLKWDKWYGFFDKTHIWLYNTVEWERVFYNNGFLVLRKNYDGLTDTPYFPLVPKLIQDICLKFTTQGLSLLGFRLPKYFGETFSLICIKNPGFSGENVEFQKKMMRGKI